MKKIQQTNVVKFLFCLLSSICCLQKTTAQASIVNYIFTTTSSSYVILSGANNLTLTAGNTDEGYFNNIPIGFDFWYMGARTNTIAASTNGWLSLNGVITNATPTNNLVYNGSPRPLLAPLWDDLDIVSASNVSYQTSGTAPNRIFTIEYKNVLWQKGRSNNISFQVKLYESSGKISYIYSPQTNSISYGSASIGIAALATGQQNYLAVHTDGTANIWYDNGDISINPAAGLTYSFTPPAPAAPTSLVFSNSTSTSITLNWSDNSVNEVGFAIYQSIDGINYNFVTQVAVNAISSIQTIAANTLYYWKVYAVTEGGVSLVTSSCMAPPPIITTPFNYCLNATATALTATGANLLWGTIAATGSVGGTTPLTSGTYVDNTWNNKKTTFTTFSPNVTITTIDYYVPAYQAIAGISLSIYNKDGIVLATSSTTTTVTAIASAIKVTNTFNYTLLVAGNYSIGVASGSGNIGSDNPSFPITESTGSIKLTGVSSSGNRCFNNVQFTVAGSSSTAPIPSTITAGSTNNYVSQTINGCTSPLAIISVNVSSLAPAISQLPNSNIIANYKFNSNANDISGNNDNGTLQNVPALIADRFGNASSAYNFNGSSQYISTATSFPNPGDFSVAIWFKTAVAGGKLIGFGAQQTGLNTQYDRNIYMDNTGHIYFGINNSSIIYASSTLSYNDNNWHLVTGTVSSTTGLFLYIDGVQVGANALGKVGQSYTGYWRIGYDNINGSWPSQPTNKFFTGALDDALIYSRALSSTEIGTIYNSPDGAGNNGPVCNGSPVTLTSTFLNGATYAWTGPNNFSSTSQNPNFIYSVANSGTYILKVSLNGCSSLGYTNVVSSSTAGLWTGIGGSAFTNPNNWCSGLIPTSAINVTIPGGVVNYPVISTAQSINNITIQSGASLIVSGATLQIAGQILNTGVFDASAGTIEMNGTIAQTIPANVFVNNNILNLIITNNVTINGLQNITGSLAFGSSSKTLATNGFINLKSTASGTARLADITNGGANSGNSITGNIIIERYIPAKRAWRLLAAPVASSGAPTINAAWQEGATLTNPISGYGTQITGGTVLNGFDLGVNKNLSIMIYNSGSSKFLGLPLIPGTNTSIASYPGYFLFVRGDRSTFLSQGINALKTPTTLRIIGQVNTNNIVVPISTSSFSLVGNPYPAAIDFHTLTKTNVKDVLYLWDPKIGSGNGIGGYVTLTWNTGSNSYLATTSVSPVSQYIPSGEAFFVTPAGGGASTLTFKETDKNNSGSDNTFRPMNNNSLVRVNLFAPNTNAPAFFADGVLTSYDNNSNNKIDEYDALKLYNSAENVSIEREGKMISIESRQTIQTYDTTFLKFSNLKQINYNLQITTEGMENKDLYGLLKDKYATTINNTLINMAGLTTVPFTVTSNAASYKADRFSIVFAKLSTVAPVLVLLKASAQQKDIAVNWKVAFEKDINNYTVEKSVNGINFTTAVVLIATANTEVGSPYNWLDANVTDGDHYYRIKATGISGKLSYSPTVKVIINKQHITNAITAYPNSIKNNKINFQLTNVEKGNYTLQLYNTDGQLIKKITLLHDGNNYCSHNFTIDGNLAAGKYQLQLFGKSISLSTSIIKE